MKRIILFYLVGFLFLSSSVLAAPPADTPPPSGERMVSLDFDNVDLPVMVKFISELTGKNFVIDEQVRGKVTIFSPVKIPTSKAYDVFISVLEMKGFTVIQTGAVYQILPYASSPPNRSMHLYTVQNTVAEEISQVLTSMVSRAVQPMRPRSNASDEITGQVQIVTDKTTNQLIITASDEDYAIIEKILKSLDKKRRQVFVEAVVMEMSLDKTREIGANLSAIFGFVPSPSSDISILGSLNFGGDIIKDGVIPLLGSGKDGASLAGLGDFSVRPINARTFLKALQTSSDVNVLSTPQILTTDRQKAELSVAENVPFPGATNNTTAGTTVTVERKDVGIILRLTPTVMDNSQIKMELYQEISSVISDKGDKTLGPTTSKRFANTTVIVRDGQTAVIGGLIADTINISESKIPFLGDIPILGYLFKSKKKIIEKKNLLIFVTPHLVPDGDDRTAADTILQREVEESMTFLKKKKEAQSFINENTLIDKNPVEGFLNRLINLPK